MAESLESRKFERKPMFDVPLPMRKKEREVSTMSESTSEASAPVQSNTMAFSLLTKRGNRQQVQNDETTSLTWLTWDANRLVLLSSRQTLTSPYR
jgi:regulator of nonsense transcripts 2